jgi:RHS repeat-associated protein
VTDGNNAEIARYTYDPFDRRLTRTSQGQTTCYLPSPWGLLAEADDTGKIQVSYGWHPQHDDGTAPLFLRLHDEGGASRAFYYHNDHLGTPQRLTDPTGELVWAADYDGFGEAQVRTADEPVISNLRYPGQYFDAETGLHYNDRRYYDPDTGRYLMRDPLGPEGNLHPYLYAAHSPGNFIDPTGEILPFLLGSYARCFATCLLLEAATDLLTNCGDIRWKDHLKECGLECVLAMLPIPDPCGKFGKLFGTAIGLVGGLMNSFTPDTLVHVRPAGATDEDAWQAKTELRPIGRLKPGDEVLAWAEWKERGSGKAADRRLSYEKVTDLFTSLKEQRLIRLELETGETITATAGHPFQTPDGWRDAILLKRGGQLLLKGTGEKEADPRNASEENPGKTGGGRTETSQTSEAGERTVTITSVRTETRTLQVFNLEVANAHTFFVGEDGVLVHNAGRSGKQQRLRTMGNDDKLPSHARGWIQQELNAIKCRKRKNIRVPKGYEMAHSRGYEAKNGFGYQYSNLQNPDLHKLQHKYEGY